MQNFVCPMFTKQEEHSLLSLIMVVYEFFYRPVRTECSSFRVCRIGFMFRVYFWTSGNIENICINIFFILTDLICNCHVKKGVFNVLLLLIIFKHSVVQYWEFPKTVTEDSLMFTRVIQNVIGNIHFSVMSDICCSINPECPHICQLPVTFKHVIKFLCGAYCCRFPFLAKCYKDET